MAVDHPQSGRQAVRLVFGYGPDGIELSERQPLTKQVPPTSDVDPSTTGGVFVEVRGADDTVLYRRAVPAAIPLHGEVFDPSGEPSRVTLPGSPRGTFDVIVPDHAAAADIVLLASPDRLPGQLGDITREAMEPGQGASPIRRFAFRAAGDVGV